MLSNRLVYNCNETLFGCIVIDPDELTGDIRKEYIDSFGRAYLVERIDGDGWSFEEAHVSLAYDILRKKYLVPEIKARTFWFINAFDKDYLIGKATNKILKNE